MNYTRVLMIEIPTFSHFVKNVTRKASLDMDVIDAVVEPENALELVRAHLPDVLVVDLRNESNGIFNILKTISSEYPRLLMIGRTKDPEINFVLDAVSAGVAGFINEHICLEELVKAVYTIRQGNPYFPQNIVHQVVQNLQAQYAVVNG